MNLKPILTTILLATTTLAQTTTHKPAAQKPAPAKTPAINWSTVPTTSPLHLTPATVAPAQREALNDLLLNRAESDGWGCEDDSPPDDWLKDLTLYQLPLADIPAYLVQAGNTCGRSGKDSPNAALWIVAFQGAEPVLFATPQEGFNGALYSVQPTLTHGLPDLVVTWRVSPTESDLTWLQYDGKIYTATAGAKLLEQPNTPPRIQPAHYPTE